jgi:phosphohistidine swiveling domain-containing protein
MKKSLCILVLVMIMVLPVPSWSGSKEKEKEELKKTWNIIRQKVKGPFTINYCTCTNGKKAPVADDDLRVRPNPCKADYGVDQIFCSAYRSDLAEKLAEQGLYMANIFSNEVYLWDSHHDHHRLAKGFILEKFYMETHPQSKLTLSRATGGISGAEFEAKYAPLFFSKYYALPDWSDFQNYLIQYELQKRFFCRGNLSLINDIRNQASAIYRTNKKFKPVKDLIHNRMSSGLIPLIRDFQKSHPEDEKNTGRYEKLIDNLGLLTRVNKKDLNDYVSRISHADIKKELEAIQSLPDHRDLDLLHALGNVMVSSRRQLTQKQVPPKQAVEFINLNISANLLMRVTAERLARPDKKRPARDLLAMMRDLTAGVYGAGLISQREYDSAFSLLDQVLKAEKLTLGDMYQALNRASRVVEWSQTSIRTAYADVWEPWVTLFPDVQGIADDMIRSSPLIDYAMVVRSLREALLARLQIKHHILGRDDIQGVRALNPGLAMGPLVMYKEKQAYTRDDILCLPSTNAELTPVAGIVTKDEGNVVSHVQLLARALGVPNAVFLEDVYSRLEETAGKNMFYAITPMGRIILKRADRMDETDKEILAEYQRNKKRKKDADVRGHSGKLQINADKLDLAETRPLPLDKVRRKHSGSICGPKAAFLGELAHHFPDKVSRGVVVPFGVYATHFERAAVVVPDGLKDKGLVQAGAPLSQFVRRTYDIFFNQMLLDTNQSSSDLAAWIQPRLEVIRHSILKIHLNQDFVRDLKQAFREKGLLRDAAGNDMVGVFVRSDTNVEDMPNFNGAGLNLTLFNLMKFDDVLEGIKKVWASPFTYRSFSWRQSVISDPNLVFPSILILESVPSEKSGVLITADVDTGNPDYMTIATAEGVGGTVDGSPAETLLCRDDGQVTLLSQFKAPEQRILIVKGRGGVKMVPSTGSEYVLTDEERLALVQAAGKIRKSFAPEKDAMGRPLPWDIEYGFVKGKLFLFQTRPFVGNSDLRNLPALATLDEGIKSKEKQPFSLEEFILWKAQ